jgi:hypothetical protein
MRGLLAGSGGGAKRKRPPAKAARGARRGHYR